MEPGSLVHIAWAALLAAIVACLVVLFDSLLSPARFWNGKWAIIGLAILFPLWVVVGAWGVR